VPVASTTTATYTPARHNQWCAAAWVLPAHPQLAAAIDRQPTAQQSSALGFFTDMLPQVCPGFVLPQAIRGELLAAATASSIGNVPVAAEPDDPKPPLFVHIPKT